MTEPDTRPEAIREVAEAGWMPWLMMASSGFWMFLLMALGGAILGEWDMALSCGSMSALSGFAVILIGMASFKKLSPEE